MWEMSPINSGESNPTHVSRYQDSFSCSGHRMLLLLDAHTVEGGKCVFHCVDSDHYFVLSM